MTPREVLRAAGLTDEEIDDMEELGHVIWSGCDPESSYALADYYFSVGLNEDGSRILGIIGEAIAFWSNTVFSITGREITFDDVSMRWRDVATGLYTYDPYKAVNSEREPISRQSEDVFYYKIVDAYGY